MTPFLTRLACVLLRCVLSQYPKRKYDGKGCTYMEAGSGTWKDTKCGDNKKSSHVVCTAGTTPSRSALEL